MRQHILSGTFMTLLVACAPAAQEEPPIDDPPIQDGDSDGEEPGCGIESSYADLGLLSAMEARSFPLEDDAHPTWKITAARAPLGGAAEDELHVEIWPGSGVFAAGPRTGTFTLAGADTRTAD